MSSISFRSLKALSNAFVKRSTTSSLFNHGKFSLSAVRAEARKKLDDLDAPSLSKFMTLEQKKAKRRDLSHLTSIPNFDSFLLENHDMKLERTDTTVLQVNIGLHCNQSCNHCHVESSPQRWEMMERETVDRLLHLLENSPTINTLDVTGGAPELNKEYRYLMTNARRIRPDLQLIDRCNLTVLYEPGQEDLKEFYASHNMKLIASLPCYSKKNVNRQRGKGVFDKSITALQDLNSVGYGIENTGLEIDLVYNPVGASLPPPRDALEQDYKRELYELFGIKFNYLHTFNNQPIKRFVDFLYRRGELEDYMTLLVNNFNPGAVEPLMCRNTVNVAWTGHIYDCDFNQMVEIPMYYQGKYNEELTSTNYANQTYHNDGPTVWDIENLNECSGAKIATDLHCYACVAGAGSKCGT